MIRSAFAAKLNEFKRILFFKEEESVKKELDEQIWLRTRIYMYVTGTLVALWGAFDSFIDFDNLWFFLTLRAIYTPITFLLASYFYLRFFRSNHKRWAMIHYIVLILDIGVMVLWTDHFVKYLIGFSTIFWGASVIMLWRFWHTVIPGLIAIAIAFIRFYFFPHNVEFNELVTGLYYFSTCLVFTSVISGYGYWNSYKISAQNIELKSTQDKLVQAEKMAGLSKIVTTVAHEINTPVGIAMTASSDAEDKFKSILDSLQLDEITLDKIEDPANDGLKSIRSTIDALSRTANLVDKFKETTVDQASDKSRQFNLTDYLRSNVIEIGLGPMLNRSDIDVIVGGEEHLEINSFPGAFSQIFTNLVINSFDHGFENGHQNGEISIEVKRIADKAVIHYSDNGKGIDPEILPRIFDPFFSGKGVGGGNSGLGLSIVYNIITTVLRGQIEALVSHRGAEFIITIPISNEMYA